MYILDLFSERSVGLLCWTDAIWCKYIESKPDLNTVGLVHLKLSATCQTAEKTEARKMLTSRDSKQRKP